MDLMLCSGDNIEFLDKEWQIATNADESREYCKIGLPSGGEVFRCYKPSEALLLQKRGAFKIIEWFTSVIFKGDHDDTKNVAK